MLIYRFLKLVLVEKICLKLLYEANVNRFIHTRTINVN